jgi:prevent-host-death family protein
MTMQIALNNIVPISQARARLTELADEVATDGLPKLFTRNGTGYVALISAGELEELENFRNLAHVSSLLALAQALPEIQSGGGMPVDVFKAKAKARVAKLKSLSV